MLFRSVVEDELCVPKLRRLNGLEEEGVMSARILARYSLSARESFGGRGERDLGGVVEGLGEVGGERDGEGVGLVDGEEASEGGAGSNRISGGCPEWVVDGGCIGVGARIGME